MAPNSSLRAVQGGLVAISHTGEDFVLILARALDLDRTHQVGGGGRHVEAVPGRRRTASQCVWWKNEGPGAGGRDKSGLGADLATPEAKAHVAAERQGFEHDVCECVEGARFG